MDASRPIVQAAAREVGSSASQIWLWGQGARPQLPVFADRWGVDGRLTSAIKRRNQLLRHDCEQRQRQLLANLRLVEADYLWATEKLAAAAKRHCNGRIVSMLEGGYDLNALARSVAVHVKALMDNGA